VDTILSAIFRNSQMSSPDGCRHPAQSRLSGVTVKLIPSPCQESGVAFTDCWEETDMDLASAAQILGNLGEFVAAIAVVATLAYLSIQIRDQNRERRAASTHQVLDAIRRENDVLKRSEEGSVFLKGLGPGQLTGVERFQFRQICMGLLRVFEEAYYHFREKQIDHMHWVALEGELDALLALDGIRRQWMNDRDSFTEDFSNYVNSRINNQLSTTP
jgi:hypothetical protein